MIGMPFNEQSIHRPVSTSDSLSTPEKSTGLTLGFAEYSPGELITNHDIGSLGIMVNNKGELISEQQITNNIGVQSRRRANSKETPLFMGLEAAQAAYKENPGKIDAVIVTTNFPSHAKNDPTKGINLSTEIAGEFSVSGFKTVFHAGCAAFGAALHCLRRREKEFLGSRILFVDTQNIHQYLRRIEDNIGIDGKPIDKVWQPTLFTDGARAMIGEYGKDFWVVSSHLYQFRKKEDELLDPNDAIKMPIDVSLLKKPVIHFRAPFSISGTIEQDGNRVYRILRSNVPQFVREDLGKGNFPDSEVPILDIHQASGRIVEDLIQLLPEYKIARDYKDGNPSSGSLPKAYGKAYSANEIKIGDRRGFAVYGAGLLVATGVVQFGPQPDDFQRQETEEKLSWEERRDRFMRSGILRSR